MSRYLNEVLPALIPAPQCVSWLGAAGRLQPLTVRKAAVGAAHPDAYELAVGPKGCRLAAATSAGVAAGRCTLEQMRRQSGGLRIGSAMTITDYPTLSVRALHADIKYLPARHDWMMQWLDQLAAWKLNMIILEYEDRFPYRRVPSVRAAESWSPGQVAAFVRRATELGIEVVPLLQSLGHLEYVLVHPEHAHLRELPDVYSQACPLNPGTFDIFRRMAEELLEQHADSRFLHIGADETCFLGQCPACARRTRQSDKLGLYLDYIRKVCEWVAGQGRRPMFWDDIVRREPERIRELPRAAVPVYWAYSATGTPVDETKEPIRMPDLIGLEKPRKPKTPEKGARPYAEYRRHGYDVIMAPCFTSGGMVPDAVGAAANCRYLATEAAAHGCLGIAATSWACLFTPFSLSYHAMAAAADAAWNPLPSPTDMLASRRPSVATDFDRRFCREFLGLPDDSVVHALRLLENGAMFAPGGQIFPTAISEPTFVDPSFVIEPREYAALGAALFRPDWPSWPRVPDWDRIWEEKVRALGRSPERGRILSLLADQRSRARAGLALLKEQARKVSRHPEFMEGLLAGAEVRCRRVEQLHAMMTGAPVQATPPRFLARLRRFYEQSLAPADARRLAAWLCTGMAEAGRRQRRRR